MEFVPKKKLQLLAGRTHPLLAQEIARHLGVELGETNLLDFANSEMRCRFGESVRGADVFVIQTHCESDGKSVNDSIFEQLIMIDAAKRASAKRITAVCPYYGYARQDRKSQGREPITAKLVADLLQAAGANRVVSVDLHAGQIQGFFNGPFDHLTAMPVLVEHLKVHLPRDVVVVAPDAGRIKAAERFARHLGNDMASVYKRRHKAVVNEVEALGVMGEVTGRSCVLVDDMIDTAGTMCAAVDQLKSQGASQVWAVATHAVFSGPAIDRLKNSVVDRVVVTDTLPLPADKQIDKVQVLPVAKLIADAIDAVFEDTSVSDIFGGENQA